MQPSHDEASSAAALSPECPPTASMETGASTQGLLKAQYCAPTFLAYTEELIQARARLDAAYAPVGDAVVAAAAVVSPDDVASAVDTAPATSNDFCSVPASADVGGPRKKARGQNKDRSGTDLGLHAGADFQFCRAARRAVEAGEDVAAACRYGDRCHYSHDAAAYLASKPADLGPRCHVYDVKGACPAGFSCRFGSAHTRSDGSQIPHPSHAALAEAHAREHGVSNTLTYDTVRLLSKRKYAYLAKAYACERARACVGDAPARPAPAPVAAAEPAPPAAADVADAEEDARGRDAWKGFVVRDARIRSQERPALDLKGKIVIAPLTTVGNMAYRVCMVTQGADVTVCEMAHSGKLVAGDTHEWALLRRNAAERVFGIQIAGCHVDTLAGAVELINRHMTCDFIDINCGCPLDSVCSTGCGAALMGKPKRLRECLCAMDAISRVPITLKCRTGLESDPAARFAHKLISRVRLWSLAHSATHGEPVRPLVAAITLHGRTRAQRYSHAADWSYISTCAAAASEESVALTWDDVNAGAGRVTPPRIPLVGNGDVADWTTFVQACETVETVMLARGALVKPWLPAEIRSRSHIDMSAGERMDIFRQFVNTGLELWGSDQKGVNMCRRFLLEWLSFTCRYVPLGLCERVPLRVQDHMHSQTLIGRNDLETLLASPSVADWVRITEMLLGRVPADYKFVPKHKASAQDVATRVREQVEETAAGVKRAREHPETVDDGADVEG